MSTRVALVIVAFCCTAAVQAQKNPYKKVSGEIRLDALRRAQVWTQVDVASMDLRLGPQDGNGFQPEEVVTCDYIEKKQSGTPKFDCAITPDDHIRVKYGPRNGEIYAEVAATRLLWALGFGADRVYPTRVVCRGCPEDPIKNHKKVAGVREFAAASVERKMPGDEIQDNEGWEWVELSFVDQTRGGASLAERDALKLLAALIQHTDSKARQQRLVCLDRVQGLVARPDGSCEHPFMMINDVGKTFGKATLTNSDEPSAVNLEEWVRTPVWKEDEACVAKLSKSYTGSLENPKISEGGRQFLSDLLAQLSDEQIRDMFEVARFNQRDPRHSVDEWVIAFKQKRDQIANRRCLAAPNTRNM